MNAKQIDQIDKRIREICTYHGDEGTSGYLLSNEQFDQIRHAIAELLEGLRVEEIKPNEAKPKYSPFHDGFNQAVKQQNKLAKEIYE